MGLEALLKEIEHKVDTSDTPRTPARVSPKPTPRKACTLDTRDTSPKDKATISGEPGTKPHPPFPCQGCPALEIIDVAGAAVAGCVKSLSPASPWREEWRPIPAGMTRCPEKPREAQGYGCGKCGANLYREVPGGWQCSGCGKVFDAISGSRGPRLLTTEKRSEAKQPPAGNRHQGKSWCRQHQEQLLAAEWTEAELFNDRLLLGLAHLGLWDRPGLQVVFDGGLVRFKWTRADGGQVEQVGKPMAAIVKSSNNTQQGA